MACSRNYCFIVSSLIGTVIGVAAFILFFCLFGNIKAGTWSFLSSVFATICLHLHVMHEWDRLEDYHSPQTLGSLLKLGLCVTLCSTAFTIWYIFAAVYWPTSFKNLEDNSAITAVWSFMTAKWGFFLVLTTKRYIRVLGREYPHLLHS